MTQERLNQLLGTGRALSMVPVTKSRRRVTVGYRLFVVDSDYRIRDVTGIICRTIGQQWNSIDGTYETREPYRAQHSDTLAYRLKIAIGSAESIPVLTV